MHYADTNGNQAFCYCGWCGEYPNPQAAEAAAEVHQNTADDGPCGDFDDESNGDDRNVTTATDDRNDVHGNVAV